MIINSTSKQPFCKRVQYSHQTDVFYYNAEAQNYVDKFKSSFRVKKCMSAPKLKQPHNNYNHYYINPELRYIKKSNDPKRQKALLQNEEFVYYKLHDKQFNNWNHPFQKINNTKDHLKYTLSEQQVKKLVKFKEQTQRKGKGRIPLLVDQYINHKKMIFKYF